MSDSTKIQFSNLNFESNIVNGSENEKAFDITKLKKACDDVLKRANLGFEVMHERNAHTFPLDLASAESTNVALTAPQIG